MKIFIVFFSLVATILASGLIIPIAKQVNVDKQKVDLGRLLFFDTLLSKDKTISCASCHKPSHGWADTTAVSDGIEHKKGKINSPTVLNSVYSFKQLWDGSKSTLKQQASGPIHNSYEMNMTKLQIEQRLNADTKYQQDFEKVYHKKTIDFDEVVDAIAEFEKTLITPNSKFDQFLKGKVKLTKDEQKGYLLFETFGCITCHNGMNIGGNSFQKIGIVIKYDNCYKDKFEVTKRKFDRCVYKVPTLRNIELTSPYFHDGSAKNLDEAIQKMSYHNLGFEIDNSEVQYIKAFLKTLTGTLQMDKE